MNLKKLIVAVISFDGVAWDWYQSKEDREPFADWKDLKTRLLARFWSTQKGLVCGQFFVDHAGDNGGGLRNLFDKLVVLLMQLLDEVLEETFLKGLEPLGMSSNF